MRFRLVLFGVIALVTSLAVPYALLSMPFALVDGRAMATGRACERADEWNSDVAEAEQLDRRWFPPRVRCRYEGYFRPSPSVPEWEDRESVVVAPVALLLAVTGVRVLRRQAKAGV